MLDLGETFLDILEKYTLVDFHLIEDEEFKRPEKIDIAFVEGNVTRKDEAEKLEKIRKQTTFLVALGACAHLGSVQRLKNYGDKKKIAATVYPSTKKIENRKIEPLAKYIAVDFIIPGCPPNNQEVLTVLQQIALGRKPYLPDRPVCYECQIRGYPCLLLEKKPCLGPMIRGGCQAICLAGGLACTGCRGLTREPNQEKMKSLIGQQEFKRLLEIFGNKP